MILPKGTVEYSKSGGEKTFKDIIGKMSQDGVTGYLLVLGSYEEAEGGESEFTGQIVYKNGKPQLVESIIKNQSSKGDSGIYPLYKSMLNENNKIELHTKIDVGPPLAFFKECKVDPSKTDPESFMEDYRKELEEKRRREEEERRKRERKEEIKRAVEGWKEEGFVIKNYPKILESSHEELESWFKGITSNRERIEEIIQWAGTIEDKEVQEKVRKLKESSKDLEEMEGMEVRVKEIINELDQINEKRKEMEKWVNLWKDEGFNTTMIEEALKEDLNTAWNELTKFMDQIQQLKDLREELGALEKEEDSGGFQSEIREIDFLTNDPTEIPSIRNLLDKLKDTIREEKEKKESILKQAEELEKEGFDISTIRDGMKKRYADLLSDYQILKNNAERIREIRKELEGMDRRDIPEVIDHLRENMSDPLKLDDYEKEFNQIESRLDQYAQERKDLVTRIEGYGEQGFKTDSIQGKSDSRLEEFKTSFNGFRSRVESLKNLASRVESLDRRWVEDDIKEVESKLFDPEMVEEITSTLDELDERIREREEKRQKVREDLERWSSGGFNVNKLEEVIEDDLPAFTAIHSEIREKIEDAKESLSKLEDMDTSHFPVRAQEVKSRLHDPYGLENARKSLETLETDIKEDSSRRDDLRNYFKTLEGEGFDLAGMDNIFNASPENLPVMIEEFRQKVSKVEEMKNEMDEWDALETSLLSQGMDELSKHIIRLSDYDGALNHFNEFRTKVLENARMRDEIKNDVERWKDEGYLISDLEGKLKSPVEDLSSEYSDISSRIEDLKRFAGIIDDLNTEHFKSEATDIEFKLQDPSLVNEIEDDIHELSKRIEEDEQRRKEFSDRIDDYVSNGYTGAKKLEDVLDQDISIIELEFKDFDKEVQMLKKYMESTGYVPRVPDSPAEEKSEKPLDEEESSEEVDQEENLGEEEPGEPVQEEEVGEKEEQEDKKPQEEEREEGSFLCTNCGEQVPADSPNCPSCGASFEGEVYECPRCHSEVPEGSSKCPGCGAEFEL